MSTQRNNNGGGPAFPEVRIRGGDNYNAPTKIYYQGMSLRDWFAGMALQGMIANVNTSPVRTKLRCGYLAKNAFQFADAMLEARKKDHIIDRGEDK